MCHFVHICSQYQAYTLFETVVLELRKVLDNDVLFLCYTCMCSCQFHRTNIAQIHV